MLPAIIFAALLFVAGAFMIVAPNAVNRFDRAKDRAVMGWESPLSKNRPTAQRAAGVVVVVAALIIAIVAIVRG